jgi:hypothetical protein
VPWCEEFGDYLLRKISKKVVALIELLVYRFFSCYIFLMDVTQTVEIPESHRITLDVPPQIPAGKVILTFTSVSAAREEMPQAQELELINRNAERLNREALDVLSFQNLDI